MSNPIIWVMDGYKIAFENSMKLWSDSFNHCMDLFGKMDNVIYADFSDKRKRARVGIHREGNTIIVDHFNK